MNKKVMQKSAEGLLPENNLDYINSVCLNIDISNISIAIPTYYFDLWGEKLYLDSSKYYMLLLSNPEYDDIFDLLDNENTKNKKIRYILLGNLKRDELNDVANDSTIQSTPNLINKNI